MTVIRFTSLKWCEYCSDSSSCNADSGDDDENNQGCTNTDQWWWLRSKYYNDNVNKTVRVMVMEAMQQMMMIPYCMYMFIIMDSSRTLSQPNQWSENDFEHLQQGVITFAQMQRWRRHQKFEWTQSLSGQLLCLTVIKSVIQVKTRKNCYNYSSQYTWKSEPHCSSSYRQLALGFRPLIGTIIAWGINSMTPSLSDIPTLHDSSFFVSPN